MQVASSFATLHMHGASMIGFEPHFVGGKRVI
jgi:hypothetical protein